MRMTDHAAQFPRSDAAPARRQRRLHRFFAFVLLGPALATVTASAQTPPRGARPVFDTNNDGVVDEQELRASREVAFERADTDRDGYLTPAESNAARMGDVERLSRGLGGVLGRRFGNAESADQLFRRLDADNDGRVSEQEFLDAPHPLLRFDADGDGDGRVTREEVEKGRKALRRVPL